VRRHRLGVAPLACLGQHHVDSPPVHVAAAPFDQAVPGQPVDQAGQRALAEVHGLGQVLGAELAPLALGEPLTEISWRWTLLVPAPVAVVVLAAAIRLIPRGERTARGDRRFDLPGALTVTAAMLLLVYTVVSAQQAGWGSARTVGSFAAVAVLLGVFAVIERRSRDPLVPFAIFSSRALRRASIGAVTLFGTYISFQFLVTQYLQTLSGWSALSTALAFLPAGVMVVVLSTRMASLLSRFGPAPLTALAFSCLVIAYGIFLRAGVRPDYPAVMLPATLLIGLAFGLGFSSLTVAATAGVPDAEQGLAASLFQTSFQVGGAVVLAVVTAVVDASGAGRAVSATATLAAYRPALILITGVAAVGALVALSGLRSQRDVAVAQTDEPATGTAAAEVATVSEFARDITVA
jgi:predicted MFS family arabinose efflux permease